MVFYGIPGCKVWQFMASTLKAKKQYTKKYKI